MIKSISIRNFLAICTISAMAFVVGCKSPQAEVTPARGTPTSTPKPTATQLPTPVEIPTEESEAGIQSPEDQATQSQPYDQTDPSNQVVVFWHPFTGSQAETLQMIIDSFNTSNEWGISIKAEYQGNDEELDKKMLTFLNTEDAPDLVIANSTQAAAYFLGGAVVDMRSLVNHPDWGLAADEASDYFPGFFDQRGFPSFGGSQLIFPLYGEMNVLYYNADWLAELGYPDPPNTPGAFMEAACTATGQPFSGATAGGSQGVQFVSGPASLPDWVSAFGGKLYDVASGSYIFDKNVSVEAMTFLQNLVLQGCGGSQPDPETVLADFSRGTSLFAIDSTTAIPNFRAQIQSEANFNWRVAPLPHTTRNPAANLSGTYASILQTQPETQLAAWLFLKYFTTPQVQETWVEGTHTLPVRGQTAAYLAGYFTSSPAYQMTLDWLNYGTSEPALPGYQSVQRLAQDTLKEILAGAEVTPSLGALDAEANRILQEAIALIPEKPDPWADIDPSGQTITFWHAYTGERQAMLEEIVHEFNATNIWGITVIPERQESYGDIFVNLLPILGSEIAPGLVLAYQEHAAAYYLSGGLLDLTSLENSSVWGYPTHEMEDFYPAILAQDIFPVLEGVRLGYPLQRSTDVLYYNADWLTELGYQMPPSTLEEFKGMACAAVTPYSQSLAASSLGYNFYLDSTRFASWVIASGGELFDPETRRFTYDNPAAIAVLSMVSELIDSGCAAAITDRAENQAAFGRGSLLFMVDSSFYIPDVDQIVAENADFEWAVVRLPSAVEEVPSNVFGASLSVAATIPEAQLASWLFIKYYTSPEIQARWTQATHYLPIRGSAAEHMGEYLTDNPNYQAALELLADSVSEPSLPGYDFVRQEVELALEAILGGSDPEPILASLSAAANQVLAERLER